MSCKLFVANFPYTTTNEELSGLFSSHGEVVTVKVATDRETGRSRGFGFVEMASKEAADTAIRELDGYQIGGRPLAVRVAEERERPQRSDRGPPRSGGGGFGGGGGGGFGGPRGGGGGFGGDRGGGGGFGGDRGGFGGGGFGGDRGGFGGGGGGGGGDRGGLGGPRGPRGPRSF
jgi:hypothetical protein